MPLIEVDELVTYYNRTEIITTSEINCVDEGRLDSHSGIRFDLIDSNVSSLIPS